MDEQPLLQSRKVKRYVLGSTTDLLPGERLIVELDGRSVGIFNVEGRFFALHNRCPHSGGALCQGPITGTALPTRDYRFVYGHEGQIVRCAWHGWEFDIASGQALVDPRVRARTFPVTVENDCIVVHI